MENYKLVTEIKSFDYFNLKRIGGIQTGLIENNSTFIYRLPLKYSERSLITILEAALNLSSRDIVYKDNPNDSKVPRGYKREYNYVQVHYLAAKCRVAITPVYIITKSKAVVKPVDLPVQDECPICLLEIEQNPVETLCCHNIFCKICLDTALSTGTDRKNRCPCCRSYVGGVDGGIEYWMEPLE